MRFTIGSPPSDEAFEPENQGWTRVRYPGPYALIAMGLPIGSLTAMLLWLGWKELVPPNDQFSVRIPVPLLWAPVVLLLAFFAGMLLVVLVHELLHCAGHPRMGLSSASYIGAWPTKLLFYAVYLGGIGRDRYLVMAALPFVVISLVPLAVCLVVPVDGAVVSLLMAVSIFNGFSSCGDMIIAPIIWSQVPRDAEVRDQGWHTYWKINKNPALVASVSEKSSLDRVTAEP